MANARVSSLMIRSTRNYGMFQRSEGNRRIRMPKHSKLIRSMKKSGFLPWWPIVVFPNGTGKEVLDGQHRLETAKGLQLPVYYVVADKRFDIPEINDCQKTWGMDDYAHLYASAGNQHYQTALEFHEKYRKSGVTMGAAFALLAGTLSYGNIREAFRFGKYQVQDSDWAERVVSVYCPIVGMSSAVRHGKFLEACMATCRVEEFNPSRMIQGAETCREKLVTYSNRDAYLTMMEEIYNFRRRQLFPLKIQATIALRDHVKDPKDVPNEKYLDDEGVTRFRTQPRAVSSKVSVEKSRKAAKPSAKRKGRKLGPS